MECEKCGSGFEILEHGSVVNDRVRFCPFCGHKHGAEKPTGGMLFYDALKNRIFKEAPKSWTFERTGAFAYGILDMVKVHCGKMQAELNDLDKVIDDLSLELKALREGWLFAREDVLVAIEGSAFYAKTAEQFGFNPGQIADEFIGELGEGLNADCRNAVVGVVRDFFYGWYIRRVANEKRSGR